jgi:hypothetical protein
VHKFWQLGFTNIFSWELNISKLMVAEVHTTGLVTIFIQIYMDAPPGMPGVSKEPKGHKDQYLDVFLH